MLEASQLYADTETRILDAVLRSEGTSRSELAQALGLTLPSVVRALQGMREQGLVRDDQELADSGRTRGVIRAIGSAARIAGVSVEGAPDGGGCLIRAASVTLVGTIAGEVVERQLDTTHWGAVTDGVVGCIADLVAANGRHDAAGVSVGGYVDSRTGAVMYSVNLGWEGRPVYLGENISRDAGMPVTVENNANALALYDRLYGQGRGEPWFASLIVARGVGAGLFLASTVAVGHAGRAGEFGHNWVCDEGRCGCGRVGCLEAQIGSAQLLERLRLDKAFAKVPKRLTADLGFVTTSGDADPDGLIGRELARCGTLLGRSIASLCNIVDMGALIVRHTGLFDSQVFAEAVRVEMEARILTTPEPVRFIDPIRLKPLDAVRGAAAASLFSLLHESGVADLGRR